MVDDSNKKDESNINEFEIYNNLEKMFRRYELSYIQFDINFFHSKEYKSIYYNFGDKGIGFFFRLYKELFSSNNQIKYDIDELIKFKTIKKNEVDMLNYIIELDLFSVNAANILYSNMLFENLYIMKKQVAAREINKLNTNELNIKYSLKSHFEILKQYQEKGSFIVLKAENTITGEIYNKFVCPNDYFEGKPKVNLLTGEVGNITSNIVNLGKLNLDKFLADKNSNDEENEENNLKNFNFVKTNL